jgi:putative inorganic carbon (HCO3(-)) transporter
MAMVFIIPNLVKQKEHLDKIVKIIIFSCFIVSLFGLYQFLGDVAGLPSNLTGLREHYTSKVFGFPRIQSTCLEPLYFANYLLIPISLCLALLSRKKEKFRFAIKPLYLVLILGIASINLILTLSRGGYLGFVTVVLLSLIIFFKSFFTWKKVLIFILIASVAFISVYYFLKLAGKEKAIETFLTQATNITQGPSVVERTSTYEAAWKLFQEHPWLGIGVGNFGPVYSKQSQIIPEKIGWPIVNNEFLEILAETGIFGFLSFLALLVVLIFYSIQAIRKTQDNYLKTVLIALLVAFCGILVQYQTFSTLYIVHIWFLVGLMIATGNLAFKEINGEK